MPMTKALAVSYCIEKVVIRKEKQPFMQQDPQDKPS